jgi:hypothetical protein
MRDSPGDDDSRVRNDRGCFIRHGRRRADPGRGRSRSTLGKPRSEKMNGSGAHGRSAAAARAGGCLEPQPAPLGAGFEVWAPTYTGAEYRKAALSGSAGALPVWPLRAREDPAGSTGAGSDVRLFRHPGRMRPRWRRAGRTPGGRTGIRPDRPGRTPGSSAHRRG